MQRTTAPRPRGRTQRPTGKVDFNAEEAKKIQRRVDRLIEAVAQRDAAAQLAARRESFLKLAVEEVLITRGIAEDLAEKAAVSVDAAAGTFLVTLP